MGIEIVHVSDIHFGSGESHGRINPLTGLNIRFEDFVAALSRTVDYCLSNNIDVFLFSGDAYRNASPEPIYQKMFASQLKRLSGAGIKCVLVVGNHDQILRSTSSHAMSVFQTLEVPGVVTIDKHTSTVIETSNGPFQLIGLPHVTRHQLMTLEKYASLPAASLDRILAENVHTLLRGLYEDLNAEIPTVVTAHMTVDKAVAGIEQELLIGYTMTFPSDIFIDDRIDYVALGHVHKHQVVRAENPAIVYAGSLERVDFGEEKEDKGFIHVSLQRKNTRFQFHSIDPRPFVTVSADLTQCQEPTGKLREKIEAAIIPGCVLRVRYRIEQEKLPDLDERLLREVTAKALTARFYPDIIPSHKRSRLPQLNETAAASPVAALETYLTEFAPDRKDRLMERARALMEEVDEAMQGK